MGSHASHCSGLESRFLAQAAQSAVELTRAEANEIVSELIPKYVDRQASQPIGKPFDQVYDLNSIQPTGVWQGIYEDVCEELIEFGLDLQSV